MKWQFKLLIGVNFIFFLTLAFFTFKKSEPIAVVRTGEVLSRFNGMIEAEALLKEKERRYQSELDTLQLLYSKDLNKLQQLSGNKGSLSDRLNLEKSTESRYQDLVRYKSVVEEKFEEDKEAITAGALNQVNEFIQKYAEENKIKIVIGANITGNVLYGEDEIDITEEIIKGLNSSYK